MYNSACVFLLRKRLEYHEVSLGLIILDQVVDVALSFHDERICLLANLTLECLPEVCAEVWASFLLSASIEPLLETLEVNVADVARTLAVHEEWILY